MGWEASQWRPQAWDTQSSVWQEMCWYRLASQDGSAQLKS